MTAVAKKRLSIVSILAGLTIAVFTAFYLTGATDVVADPAADAKSAEQKEEKEKAPIPVAATAVETSQMSSYISATANLVPENEVKVLAEWEGRLAKLNVFEGDRIGKGQILAELAREDGEIAVEKAKIRAETSLLAYQRAEQLAQQELISSDEFDKIALASRVADQELAEAKFRLTKTFIRSPFSGRVTQRNVQPGQHIRPGDELFTVADFDPLIARIYLPEKDVLKLEEGRSVRLSLRAEETIAFQGKIRQISPVVDTATGTVKVTVEARQVPRQVRPGAFVRVDIVKDSHAAALSLPREAVVRELQKTYVFVAKDGVAEKRDVTLGLEENGRVEAVEGLAAGEQVIVAGQGGLEDGAAIRLIEAAS